ncbi:MAG: hypothetical protein Q7R95_05810 [bacterium]|nr:hypothetical protein [bacterium]
MIDLQNIPALKKLLSQYDQVSYLRGQIIPTINLKPQINHHSRFIQFIVKKKNVSSILKIHWWKDIADSKFQTELYIYNDLLKRNPHLKEHMPSLIHFSIHNLEYLELELLIDYIPLGDSNSLSKVPDIDLITKLIKIMRNFHIPKKDLIDTHHALEETRNYKWYIEEVKKIDRIIANNKILKSFYPSSSINDIIEKNKNRFLVTKYLVLNDRNPSNVLINNSKIKILDFDKSGLSNPAIDYTFLYCLLLENDKLASIYLKILEKTYNKFSYFWEIFWLDTLFKLTGLIFYWEKNDQVKSTFYKKQFDRILKFQV